MYSKRANRIGGGGGGQDTASPLPV